MAQVVSPIREPNWTNKAGRNPRAVPRRTVSAVTTPGGAQNAIARKKDEMKSDISLWERPRIDLGLSVLLFYSIVIAMSGALASPRSNLLPNMRSVPASALATLAPGAHLPWYGLSRTVPGSAGVTERYLAVKIQHIFMWSWAQANGIHFMDALVFDIFFEEVRCEYTAFEQEFMIRFESV